jgi:PAS domain S-box-containing protein
MSLVFGPRFRPYLIGVAAFLAGWAVRVPLLPFLGTSYPYLHLYPALLVAAWTGGLRAGLTTAVLSAASVQFLVPSTPPETVFISGPGIATAVFVVAAAIISVLAEERRQAIARAEEREGRRLAEERAERAVQEVRYREWLDTLVADVPAVVWEAWGEPDARAQRIDFVSRHVERMLGYSVQEWLSVPNFWLQIVHPEDRDRAAREAREIFDGRRGGTSRFRWVKRSGESIWVEGNSSVILDRDGQPVGMRGVTMDISEVMRLEAERSELLERTEAARHEAEEANRLKDEFLMTLSHELRTPLNAIWGWARILQSAPRDDERLARGLQVIDHNAGVQLHLIEDLLDVSSIIAGKLRIDMQPVAVGPIVAAVLESARPAADGKGLTVMAQLGASAVVRGDADRLQQAIRNLVSNAIKFTPAGGCIGITTIMSAGEVEITVSDTGAGIDPAVLPLIFERFRQGDSGTARTHTGLGLGLTIARSLVEAHGGSVAGVSGGIGRGATFTIRLPAIAAADEEHGLPGKPLDSAQGTSLGIEVV